MELLNKEAIILSLAAADPDSLFIDPLLDKTQIGEVTIDLRLGYDFLVSILTRKPYVSLTRSEEGYRGIESYFQTTRREIGDRFALYPGQVVLTTTLEYVSLPTNVYADVLSRSSYTRLGVHLNTMIQPGFKGCFPIELFNHGNNTVEIVVGSRMFQMRLFKLDAKSPYAAQNGRKYYGNVRPIHSRATSDIDLQYLYKILQTRN